MGPAKVLYKELGQTGISIPEIGIGTWNYHAGPGPLRRGLDAGALFIDTAESYGTEAIVREAIAGLGNRVFIATKVSPQNFRSEDLKRSVDGSLNKLGVERIDLLQLHEPNLSIPIEETMSTLADIVDTGKIRHVGVSNFSVTQLQDAQKAFGRHRIVSNQVRYNLIDRTIEKGLMQHCLSNGITLIAYCPLARGLNRLHDCDPSGTIDMLAAKLGKSPAQIVLNWALCHDAVVVIPKGNTEEHILDNCGASDWRLSAEHRQVLDSSIRFRHRTGFDNLIRQAMPRGLQNYAKRALNYLPGALRRRIQ
jgi:diketogulonate reductase-like aldo/keto reductase